jgi:3-hydroxyacyl-CoA dehydrogenase
MDERLGIAGSGAIATGLARHASETLNTIIWARSEESAERTRANVPESVEVVTDLDALSDRTIVVEAVVEDFETKRELIQRLLAMLDPEALIATTTSSLSVGDLAEASGRQEHFAALHVFNPVEKMPLVEVAFHVDVSELTHSRIHDVCAALGKTAIEVPDTPGFVVNRLLFPYLFDAVRMLEREDIEPKDLDTCMKLGAGHPMGPLALLDFVGLDVSAAIGESIGAEVPARMRELIDAGHLGRKTGRGLLEYPER